MNTKTRMTIKKELKAIAQSGCKIDNVVFDYFMSNFDKAGFNDRETIYLICGLVIMVVIGMDLLALMPLITTISGK